MNLKNDPRTPNVQIETDQPPPIEGIEMGMEYAALSGMTTGDIEDY